MKGCLQVLLVFMVAVVIINIVITAFTRTQDRSSEYYEVGSFCDEFLVEDEFTGDRHHQREWYVYEQAAIYCLEYQSLDSLNELESRERSEMRIRLSESNFWGAVYNHLVNQGRGKLNYLADSLSNVAYDNSMSRLDLARLTVSFVQDIPYSYVIPSSCDELNTGGKPCLGNVPFGIIGPYEFVHTLYGDCDTRAVLLYVLLEKMNYDPMIVVSTEYAHAMLALNIPAQGDYLSFAGKKYYFWETTATGWSIGMLPPDTNNIDYWEIALVNES